MNEQTEPSIQTSQENAERAVLSQDEITSQSPVSDKPSDRKPEDQPTSVDTLQQGPAVPAAPAADETDEGTGATLTADTSATIQVATIPPSEPAVSNAEATPAPIAPDAPDASQPVEHHPFISIEDLAALQLVGEPRVSPDGLLIAYTLTCSDLAENAENTTIWLVPAVPAANGKNQPARQLTADMFSAMLPRWSPDGHTLAFVSNRTGSMQIFALSLNGGEARQVSDLPQSVTDFYWRPDGRALVVQSPWKATDEQPGAEDESTVQIWTRLDETEDGAGYKQGRHQHLWLLDLEQGLSPTRLTSEPINHTQVCWSPDGTELAFCANRRTDPDLSVSVALWILNLASGHMRRLSPVDGLAMQPAWSPDGRWLAFYYAADLTETANVVPWIVEANGQSAPRPATTASQSQTGVEFIVDGLHFSPMSSPCWYHDSTSLLVHVQTHGQIHLNRLYINTDHEEPLTAGNGCYLNSHMSANGRTIAALRTDWFTPGDIWAMAGNGANRRRLTAVNDALIRQRQVIRPKKISFRSFDNLEIEGWLYLPILAAGERAPLVLDVHGGPTLAWAESYVHDFQVLAGLGYAVLAVNPRGSVGYGEEFCRKILSDWGGDDYRDLMLALDHVIATEQVDGSRLAITGASYGGYMTCWAISQNKRFKAAVAQNAVTSLLTSGLLSDQGLWFDLSMGGEEQGPDPETLRRSCSPMTFADAITTPLLLIHSTDDMRCPVSEAKQLFSALRRRQHPVELALYPGVSHLLDYPGFGSPKQRVDRLHRSVAWFKRHV
jgi:dipeptidyl aminopeptidase/acylaminoacyl peptidase